MWLYYLRKHKLKVLLIAVVVLAVGAFLWIRVSQARAALIPSDRPDTATMLPDLTGDITDVRVTALERDVSFYPYRASYGFGETMDEIEAVDIQDGTILQILYGYKVNDTWYDIPAENYPLQALSGTRMYSNLQLARSDHFVKIGPYCIICITTHGEVPYDTLGTTPVTDFCPGVDQKKIGLMLEDREKILAGDEPACTFGPFTYRYYFILETESIPEDYALYHPSANPFENEVTMWPFTAADIRVRIEEAQGGTLSPTSQESSGPVPYPTNMP